MIEPRRDDSVEEHVLAEIREAARSHDRTRAIERYRAYERLKAARGEELRDDVVAAYRAALWAPAPVHSVDAVPRVSTPYFAGDREIAHLTEPLRTPGTLNTLTGPAGVGKTRIALELMRAVAPAYAEGARFIELRAGGDPRRSLEQLGLRRDAMAVVLIDNAETALDTLREPLENFRLTHPQCTVLVTSRVPVGVPGERTETIPPFAVPPATDDGKNAIHFPAVAFFLERAALARPDLHFSAHTAREATRLCRMLDGIPLLLELVAAQLRFFSIAELVAKVHEDAQSLPHRMQSALSTSVASLDRDERRLLQRLAIFEAPWTIVEAENICADDRLPSAAVFPILAQLVERSLVQVESHDGTVRYRLLETTRRFVLSQSSPEDRRALEQRAADWYIAWMCGTEVNAKPDRGTLELIDRRIDNIRAALDRWSGDPTRALAAVAATRRYWDWRNFRKETLERISRLRGRAGPLNDELEFGVSSCEALCAVIVCDRDRAEAAIESALSAATRLGDERSYIQALGYRIGLAFLRGEFRQARALTETRMAYYQLHGPPHEWAQNAVNHAVSTTSLGDHAAAEREYAALENAPHSNADVANYWRNRAYNASAMGAFDAAKTYVERGLAAANKHDARDEVRAGLLMTSAAVELATGSPYAAIELLQRSLTVSALFAPPRSVINGMQLAIIAAAAVGSVREVARLQGAFSENQPRHDVDPDQTVVPRQREAVKRARTVLGQARFESQLALGRAMSLDDAVDVILSLPTVAPAGTDAFTELSPREREIAGLVADGRTNREIADQLSISLKTVENHLGSIFSKLKVTRRSQLAVIIVRGRHT